MVEKQEFDKEGDIKNRGKYDNEKEVITEREKKASRKE